MKKVIVSGILAVLSLVPVVAGDHDHHPMPPADARLDFLKSLAGVWETAAPSDGTPAGTVEFRVTAGGHAVEEVEWAGTPMEMVTLYHVEGESLVANHYCMLGNRPRLIADALEGTSIAFRCDGKPGGAHSHADQHVHAWTIRLTEDGQLRYTAELVQDGEVTMAPDMTLTRRQTTAKR